VPDNSTQSKAEEALKTLIDALTLVDVTTAGGATASHVYTGLEDESVLLPCVHCMATGAWQEPEGFAGLGNLNGSLTIKVRTNANDADSASTAARDSHIARVTAIRNGVFVSDLAAQLSAAKTEFFCIGVTSFSENQTVQDEQSWITELGFSGIFAATDL